MHAINKRSIAEAALLQAKEKLTKLNIVLEKSRTDDFGKCAKCKKEIYLGRILIRPEGIYCVNCAH